MATTSASGTEFSTGIPAAAEGAAGELPPGVGPWQLAWRRLRRNKVALFFGGLFLLIVVLCLLAPVYAHDIAHTGLADEHVTDQVKVGGKLAVRRQHHRASRSARPGTRSSSSAPTATGAMSPSGCSTAGRNSLEIGVVATAHHDAPGADPRRARRLLPRLGRRGRLADSSTCSGPIPAVLLGVALGVELAVAGIDLGLFTIQGGNA